MVVSVAQSGFVAEAGRAGRDRRGGVAVVVCAELHHTPVALFLMGHYEKHSHR